MSLLWARHAGRQAAYDPHPLYHGSHAELKPGDRLKSARDHGPGPHYTEAPEQEWRAGRVWATEDAYDASAWGRHVYEVKMDDPQRHAAEDYDVDRHDFGNFDGQWHGAGATVVRRLHPREIQEPS